MPSKPLLLFTLFALPLEAQDADSLFGTSKNDGSGLIAIIYDLKQTQTMEPSLVTPESYPKVVQEFVRKGWDETVLNRYFRITRPLYSTQIFIPGIDAGAAPKAYGVENVIKPSSWVIHYKGQVSPPEDGTYRFVGYADDAFAVAVNNKTVLIASRSDMQMESIWRSSEKQGAKAFNGELTYGDWIPLKKDEPVDLDVLVGERPGGEFCAFLLYQMQGAEYAKDKGGNPILPVFQLAAKPIEVKERDKAPQFTLGSKPWEQHR